MKTGQITISEHKLRFILMFTFVVSIFGFIVFLSVHSGSASLGSSPSPTASEIYLISSQSNQASGNKVAGVASEALPEQVLGPDLPVGSILPSSSLKPSPAATKSANLVTPVPSPPVTPSPSTTSVNSSPSPSPSPSLLPSPSPSPSPIPTPSPPGNVSATAGCTGSNPKVVITWDFVNGATSYLVFRNGNSISSNQQGTAFTDNNVLADTSYVYFVHSKNSSGESSDSNSWSVSPGECN